MELLLIVLTTIVSPALSVTSTAFKNGENIPQQYTCEGKNQNPPLHISGIPAGAKSLTIIVDDPDAPGGNFDHWILFNIETAMVGKVSPEFDIKENSAPGTEGANGKESSSYMGPCPPSGVHHYHFKVYALDNKLDLRKGATKKTVEDAMKGHIIGQGELIGLYSKKNQSK